MYNLTFNTPLSELSGRNNLFVRFFYRKALIKLTGLSVFRVSATDTTDTGVSVGKPLYCFLLWPETDTRDLKRENRFLICNGNNIDVVPKTSHCNYVLRYVASFPLIPVTPFPYGDSPLKRESAF